MTTTFADYAAAAEARKDIAAAVLGHTYALCEALRQNYIDYSIRSHQMTIDKYEFYPETGRKYHKIIMSANGSRSVHCFIDKQTGQIYKSASWKSPAKGVRYDLRLIEQREWLLQHADWAGSYLYAR
jgi:hypothetical protein